MPQRDGEQRQPGAHQQRPPGADRVERDPLGGPNTAPKLRAAVANGPAIVGALCAVATIRDEGADQREGERVVHQDCCGAPACGILRT